MHFDSDEVDSLNKKPRIKSVGVENAFDTIVDRARVESNDALRHIIADGLNSVDENDCSTIGVNLKRSLADRGDIGDIKGLSTIEGHVAIPVNDRV